MKQIITYFFIGLLMIAICSCEKESGLVNPDDSGATSSDKLKISLDKEELTLEVDKTSQLVASFTPADTENKAHEWSSSDSKVATVDAKGLVKAVAIGTANITAKSLATGATATCVVTVIEKVIPVSSVKLNKTKESILVGETLKLEATVSPENASDKKITWSSSDNTVATVDEDGTVHGLQAGTSDIIAKTTNDKTAKCVVTVENPTVEFSDLKVFNIDETSAEVSFSIVTKGVTPTEIGVCYDPEKTPTIGSTYLPFNYSSTDIKGVLQGLKSKTAYFIRTYAKEADNIYYGATIQFETLEPIHTDFKITEIYVNKIVCTTPIIDGVDLKVCYGLAPHPEITDYLATVSKGTDCYTITMDNLFKGHDYYFRAYSVKNNIPIYYDNEGTAPTIGTFGHNIDITRIFSGYRNLYRIDTNLPEGTYLVKLDSNSSDICVTKDKPLSYNSYDCPSSDRQIYIKGGTQVFYILGHFDIYMSYYFKSSFRIENVDTKLQYILNITL